jgi:hypothetical protein
MTRLSKITRIRAVSPRKRTSKVKRNFKNSTPREKGVPTPPTIHVNAISSATRYIPSKL